MSPGVLPEATVFAGRYRVIRCIAMGGMGTVYEVMHLETERRLALKVMHLHFLQSDEMRGRFRQEARVAAKVESAHIVDVFDAGFDEATAMPFFVMELLHGEELGQRLERVKRFTATEVVLYLHQTALALDKAHRAHIVHRDLKPANLFLCERDDSPPCIKVLDFGIAKLLADGSTQANVTKSWGTPMYMAPEQFQSQAVVVPATDIFALGLIAYTLLVGQSYWHEELNAHDNVFAFAAAVTGGPQEAASERATRQGIALPRSFDAWFACATAPSPADRFPSASAAVQALANALGLPHPGHEYSATVPIVPPGFTVPSASIMSVGTARMTPLSSVASTRSEAIAASGGRPRRAPLAVMGTVTAVLVASAIVSYAVSFRAPADIAPPATLTAAAIQRAAGAARLAPLQSLRGSAGATPAPPPLTSTATSASPVAPESPVTSASPAASRPPIRPARKTATKPGKANAIYRRD